jgi:hypothetical protein
MYYLTYIPKYYLRHFTAKIKYKNQLFKLQFVQLLANNCLTHLGVIHSDHIDLF